MKGYLRVLLRLNIVCLVLIFSLTGCAMFTSNESEDALFERVSQVWQAKETGRWGDVYQFSLAQFNSKITRDDFIRHGKLNVKEFEIKEIERSADSQSSVVKVCFTTLQMGIALKGVCIDEKWVLHHGKWYLDDNVSQSPF